MLGDGQGHGRFRAGLLRKSRVMQRHRLARLPCLVDPVQQADARLADVADAQRNAGEGGRQRRFHRVRQDVGLGVAALPQHPAEAPAIAKLQLAVAQVRLDDLGHLGHAAHDRRDPGRRQHVDARAGMLLAQAHEQRLRHQRVADPVGRHDQEARRAGEDARQANGPSAPRPCTGTSCRSTGRAPRPCFTTSRNTRGCRAHSGAPGIGQCSGRSFSVTSTCARGVGSLMFLRLLHRHRRQPVLVLAVLAGDDVEERLLQRLGDRARACRRRSGAGRARGSASLRRRCR